MTIVLTGGGSGGHITPILAIANEIKHRSPDSTVIYIGQTGDKFGKMVSKDSNIDKVYFVRAGKFRRFHGEGFWQFLNPKLMLKNIRDFFYVIIGILQARKLLKQLKPIIVFSRGGYVSVPVALGAYLNKIPYITHDSDPIPSLANRLIAPWASMHAVALPKDIYPYRPDKTVTTGVPVSHKFVPISNELKSDYRKKISISDKAKMIFIIGGGQGSQILNSAITSIAPHLIREYPDLYIFHGAGVNNEKDVEASYRENLSEEEQGRVKTFGYIDDVYLYSGASDIVVTRAGATNLAEFAIQGKACVVVPSAFLTGGHQIKNADYLKEKGAAVVIEENDLKNDPNRLAKQLSELLSNDKEIDRLGHNLSEFAQPHATTKIVDLILNYGER